MVCLLSHAGEVGLQTDAENTETAGVSVACCRGWAGWRVPVVGVSVEPPEDRGRDEEPAQQERPDSPVRLPRRQELVHLHHQGETVPTLWKGSCRDACFSHLDFIFNVFLMD